MECNVNNLTVYYESIGEGRPVVLLHGFTPDHRLMTGCMEPIFARRSGYHRIYPDLPGMGRTKYEEWVNNSDIMLEIVLNFIDSVLPGKNFLLAGESYGGYLSQGIIQKWPGRLDGLLLLCPLVVADKTKRNRPSHIVIKQDEELMARLAPSDADEFASMAVVQSEGIWRRYHDEIMSGIAIADQRIRTQLLNNGYEFTFDVDRLEHDFVKPTLMVLGRQDATVGYKDAWNILDHYPRATFAVLDRAGHNLQIEQETLFNCLVDEWLDRIEEG